MQRDGRVLGGERLCPRCSRPDHITKVVHVNVKRHIRLGTAMESWEMAPQPHAPKPQFPRGAVVAEGFIFWQKCFHLYRGGGSINSFWCAFITSLPASRCSHMKNSQIPSPACLWAALTHVRSCKEKRREEAGVMDL